MNQQPAQWSDRISARSGDRGLHLNLTPSSSLSQSLYKPASQRSHSFNPNTRNYKAAGVLNGWLTSSDARNPTRARTFKDDYWIYGNSGGRITIEMRSTAFDAYLQIIDAKTGKELAFNNDGGAGFNARIRFTTKKNQNYILRATSNQKRATGFYTLSSDIIR
jgi:hypothetical protein